MALKTVGALVAGLALMGTAAAFAPAHADYLSGTFDIKIYQGTGDGTSTNPDEQAQLGNPLFNTPIVTDITYTGLLDFTSTANNTIGGFLTSAGGTVVYNTNPSAAGNLLSTGNFQFTSLFSITGVSPGSTNGFVTHDDGASLYQGANTIFSSPSPTVATNSNFSLANGAFNLVYVEANGLPADLIMNVVPEPATIGMMAAGLLGLCFMRRRAV